MIIGNDKFGFILKKIENGDLEMKMIVDGNNIMAYAYKGEVRTTTWSTLGFIDFFIENLQHILLDDIYPFDNEGRNGIQVSSSSPIHIDWEKVEAGDDEEIVKMEEICEALDSWGRRHNWSFYRDQSFIPNVAFRKFGDYIEISWDNDRLFEEYDVEYVYKFGQALVDIKRFELTINDLIFEYRKILLQCEESSY